MTVSRLYRHRMLLIALAVALVYHGGLIFFTFKRTYDAFVHIFFADHYARAWFDHWDQRWYTGFTLTSYPPASQQLTGLVSYILGLDTAFVAVLTFATLLSVVGMYRFARIWVDDESAGYTAFLMVFSSGIAETIHVFGQLPTMMAIAMLLNTLPYVWRWLAGPYRAIDFEDPENPPPVVQTSLADWLRFVLAAFIMTAGTVASHHVTVLFGSVFFIAPMMVVAILTRWNRREPDEFRWYGRLNRSRAVLRPYGIRQIRRLWPVIVRCAIYGVGMILIMVSVVLPYWLWSSSDPITQVPIPHASRFNFLQETAAGLVFFVIPWGVSFFALPWVVYKGIHHLRWPLIASFGLLFLLGTGGTTPLPRLLLGETAFNILTFDRFTFWAMIISMPFIGEMITSIRHGSLNRWLNFHFGLKSPTYLFGGLAVSTLIFSMFVANLTQFRPLQPDPIDIQPILEFLNKDQHWRWRYITLGFGDQMAWLSANTDAKTVDGNYHSARRLPELTTTSIERLDGAKFRSIPGLGSLQQMLTTPEKYHFKYIFAKDQFYDPLLYFAGWHQVRQLTNGIIIWERNDVPPLPEILPRKEIPLWQRVWWGTVPMLSWFSAQIVMATIFLRRIVQIIGLRRVEYYGPGWWQLFIYYVWATVWELDTWLLHHARFPIQSLRQRLSTTGESIVVRLRTAVRFGVERMLYSGRAISSRLPVWLRGTMFIVTVLTIFLINIYLYIRPNLTPDTVIAAYYDDLDFRRFESAWSRLDPELRPSLDQYTLELSVVGGLVPSYTMLDTVTSEELVREEDFVRMAVRTEFETALGHHVAEREHTLVRRGLFWYLEPDKVDISIPPDQFFRQGSVAWKSQGRRRVTTETTGFADVLDRPELLILSSRLVVHDGRYSVVGEVLNLETDPADITISAALYADDDSLIAEYNAQSVMIHKVLPKEITPFRVDFEGVAGQRIEEWGVEGEDGAYDAEFQPDAFTDPGINQPVKRYNLFARAVVTGRDLGRTLAAQELEFVEEDGQFTLVGELYNSGTIEAIVPHVLATYYDENNEVVWVEDMYADYSIRPQRSLPFKLEITNRGIIEHLEVDSEQAANGLQNGFFSNRFRTDWSERFDVPVETGYKTMRLSIHYFAFED